MEYRFSADAQEVLENVIKSIKQGRFYPCYLIYGEEEYLVKDACDKIVDAILFEGDNGLNLFHMDGDEENVEDLCASLVTLPLIPGRKVIIFRNTNIFHSRQTLPDLSQKIPINLERDPFKAAKDFFVFLGIAGWTLDDLRDGGWEKITDEKWQQIIGERGNAEEKWSWLPKIIDFCISNKLQASQDKGKTDLLGDLLLRGIPGGNHLILTTDAIDKRKKIYKIIAEKGKVLQFSQIKNEVKQRNLFMEMARDLLLESGKKMTPTAWTAIGDKTGFGLRESMIALEKLILYTGERKIIEDTDVLEIIDKTKESTIFDLTAAFVKKDIRSALASLQELIEQGVNHSLILSMIAREIRLLLHAKIYMISGILGSFDQNMDYNQFQKTIYPHIKEWSATNTKGGAQLGGMHPYVIYNTIKNSECFQKKNLIGFLDDLVNIDITFKTTMKDPRLLLERFLVKLCT